ncbi:stress response protein [Halobacteriales archaeon QH_7_66_37]|nr:MAG: stress response protein [Halobacteriales archaeon QH_7_66_37]
MYVVNTAALTDLPMESSWEGVSQALEQEGQVALNEVEQLARDVPVEVTRIEGSPAREIVSYAEDNDVDVIVMGTHGRSGVDRLLLGSVAERVVRSSSVPVLTIRVEVNADEQS